MTKWEDNSIQFPRLLAEINACVEISEKDWKELQESMDLEEDEIIELFDRANDEWERIKQEITS
jgi:hypothetical protein